MALVLTEEQTMLRDTAAQFFKERAPVANFRKLRDTNDQTGFDKSVWKEMADLGFAGVMISEEHGGTGFGPVGLGLVLEQAGRTLAASPLVSTVLVGATAVDLGGNALQRNNILPKVASGEIVLALALEEGAHHNPYKIGTTAEDHSGTYRLNGRKSFVLDGHVADKFIVVARTGGHVADRHGLTLFIVDVGTPGLKVTRTKMVDSRNAAIIEFENVSVPSDNVLGSVGAGADILDSVLDLGRIGIAAELLGLISQVFEETVTYLKERKQFGKPIGSFQALAHRAAEMFAEIELCRSVVLDALSAVEERRNDVAQMASLAKARLSDVARLVTNEGLQMHGGMGMTDQFDVGLFMKRARVAAATFGDANFHRDRFATLAGY